jgi:hypothetical protein
MNTAARTSVVAIVLCATLALTACATVPPGPSRASLPGTGKSWDQFQADDASCRGYAASVAGAPGDAAAAAGVGSAIAGTVIGAAVGGLIGGNQGAAVGAGMGLFTGAAVGTSNAAVAGSVTQQRYDQAYFQCMYGLGNRVPAPPGFVARAPVATPVRSGPPPNAAIPPPNTPPPPMVGTPPPNAAIPPPNTPPPYQLPR